MLDDLSVTNGEGAVVKVYDVQRNNYGQIESILVDDTNSKYRVWKQASDFIVLEAGDMAEDVTPPVPTPTTKPKQKQIPGRDTKLKPDATITKPAVAPVQTDLGHEPVIEK